MFSIPNINPCTQVKLGVQESDSMVAERPKDRSSRLEELPKKIAVINLSDNLFRLSRFYKQKDISRVTGPRAEKIKTQIVSSETLRMIQKFREDFPLFQTIQSTFGRQFHKGVHLQSLFFMFLEDCLSLYHAYQTSNDQPLNDALYYRTAILFNYSRYRYANKNAEIRENLIVICMSFYSKLQKLLPVGDKLLETFNHWIALFNSNIDFTELTPIEAMILQSPIMDKTAITKRYNRYFNHESAILGLDKYKLDTLNLSLPEAIEGISHLSGLISSYLQSIKQKAGELFDDYNPRANDASKNEIDIESKDYRKMGDIFIFTTVDGNFKSCSFNHLPPKEALWQALEKGLNRILDLIKEEKFYLAANLLSELTRIDREFSFPKVSEYIAFLEEHAQRGWSSFSDLCEEDTKKAITMAGCRLKAFHALQKIHEMLDTITLLLNDLYRYEKGIKAAKIEPQQLNENTPKADPNKFSSLPPKRSSSRKKKKKLAPSASAIKKDKAPASPQISINPISENEILSKEANEPDSTLHRWMSGGPKIAQRKLWRSLAEGLQGFSPDLQSQELQHTLKRLSVTVLHNLLEQSLSERIAPIDNHPPSHNLWILRNRVENAKKSAILEDLHLGIHWSRYTCEWQLEWKSKSTLQHTPEVLAFLSEPFSKSGRSKIEGLVKQALAYHDSLFKMDAKEIPRRNAPAPTDLAKRSLDKGRLAVKAIENKVATLPQNAVWIEQWILDLRDLHGTLFLLEKEENADKFLLLFSHALSLLHGSVQSPLYHLQQAKLGIHSNRHDLLTLFNELKIELSASQRHLLTREIKGLSTVHRYPFKEEIASTVHHLFLEAIHWYIEPFEGEAFFSKSEETVFDSSLGKPILNIVRHPNELCTLLSSLTAQTMDELGELLFAEVARFN